MSAYDIVRIARSGSRPTGADYIRSIFSPFIELHGDRRFSDDAAIFAGIGMLGKQPVTAIAIDKGHDTEERTKRHFGAPEPEGYRKALRLINDVEKNQEGISKLEYYSMLVAKAMALSESDEFDESDDYLDEAESIYSFDNAIEDVRRDNRRGRR